MTGDEIKATVIIAAWRARDHLARSVSSALSQNLPSLEVVVVDDASPDDTFAVAGDLAERDDRVRVLRLDRNGGPSAARNAAIDAARGTWIAVLDADDAMRPGRLAAMITLAEAEGADAVCDDLQPVGADGQPAGPSHLARLALAGPERWSLERYLAGCQARPGQPSFGYLKPVLRRDFLVRTGLRYDPSLRNGEDFHLIAGLLARGGRLWVLPEAGYLYTRRAGSVSARLDPDHAVALAAADAAFARRPDLSADARRLMRARRARLDDLATAESVMVALGQRRLGLALRLMSGRPRAILRLGRQLGEGIRRRLTA